MDLTSSPITGAPGKVGSRISRKAIRLLRRWSSSVHRRAEASWVTAAGTVLDAASLTLSAVDVPYEPSAALCIRAGYLALHEITHSFDIPLPHSRAFQTTPSASAGRNSMRRSRDSLPPGCPSKRTGNRLGKTSLAGV